MNAFPSFPKALVLSLGLWLTQAPALLAQTPEYYSQQPAPAVDNTPSLMATVAPYRDDVRRSVLLASQEPQVLNQLVQQQANSQQAFNNLIQHYGQTKQGWFYDMARFPDIQHALALLPSGSDQAVVQAITKPMPADLQESAWKLYRHHHDDLVQVDNLNQQANQAFEQLITPLDSATQGAFRQLLGMPDVLMVLTQQPDKTAQLAGAYQANPQGVTQQLADLHDRLDAQNKQQLADYQNQLDQDPQARQELQQAGQEYARANGYNTGINPNPAWPVNSSYYYQNPYSYWFGYPSWYGSPLWYPSAWWGNTGFYYGLGGNMVLYGLPSYGFSNWFFNRGYYSYPHLYSRFNTYYTNTFVNRGYYGYSGFAGAARRAFSPSVRSYGPYNSGRGYAPMTNGNARVAAPAGGTTYAPRAWGGGNYTGSYGSGRSFGTGSYGSTRSYGGGGFGGGGHSFGGGGGGFRGGRR